MSQASIFRSYIDQSKSSNYVNHFSSGVTRYIPPQKLVKSQANARVNTANMLAASKPSTVSEYEGSEDSDMAVVPKVVVNPKLVPINSQRLTSFAQEKVIAHPLYKGSAVDLTAPEPKPRSIPVQRKFEHQLNTMRRNQQSVPNGDVKPSNFNSSKNPSLRIKTNMPRIRPMSQDSTLATHLQPAKSDAPASGSGFLHAVRGVAAAPNGNRRVTFQDSINSFKVNPTVFQQPAAPRDARLEKRRAQQNAWLERRDNEKARLDNLYSQVARVKSFHL